MDKEHKSNCCGADVEIISADEGTSHWECMKCGKSCNDTFYFPDKTQKTLQQILSLEDFPEDLLTDMMVEPEPIKQYIHSHDKEVLEAVNEAVNKLRRIESTCSVTKDKGYCETCFAQNQVVDEVANIITKVLKI